LHVEVDDRAFAALVEHCSDLIVVVDRDGTLLFANPAAARLFGVPVEEQSARQRSTFCIRATTTV